MATDCAQGKREAPGYIQVEEEEEEALSLCELPVNLIKEDDQPRKADSQILETKEEFDFCLWGGSFSKEPEMCVADEVFFQGQILPLQRNGQKLKRCESRVDSICHGSLRECMSNSSRSSSFESQNSSNSTSSTTITAPKVSKPRAQNPFHTHPSPKPQLRVPIPRQASFGNAGRKSSTWEFFRLGVVPAPEIELQDLKVRGTKNSVSHNRSTSNSRSNSNTTKSGRLSRSTHYRDKSNHDLKQFVGKGGGFLSGCQCSIETEPLDTVIINSSTKSTNKTESATRAMKEKVMFELKKQKQRQRQKQGKKAVSRRRIFEWLKELSHASYPDEEALLLNS